jgi:hypothetical protein
MTHLSDFADAVAFGHIDIDPSKHGLEYRKNKSLTDCLRARNKAFKTLPFKTEMHLLLLEAHLAGIVKKVKKREQMKGKK